MPSSSTTDERAVAGQCFQDTLDDLVKQCLQLFSRRCAYAMERRYAALDVIDAIEYQTMQMDVEIGRRTKTLNQRNHPGLYITPLESRPSDQKSRNSALNDLQYRREQMRMSRK